MARYNKLLSSGFITEHMMKSFDKKDLDLYFPEYPDLSYPARSLLTRINNYVSGYDDIMQEIWSQETYRQIISYHQDIIEREILEHTYVGDVVTRLKDIFGIDVLPEQIDGYAHLEGLIGRPYTLLELLHLYYGYPPTDQDIYNVVNILMEKEIETSDCYAYCLPINGLMNGLFFAEGYMSKLESYIRGYKGQEIQISGNLQFLSSDDWGMLRSIYEFDNIHDNKEVITRIIDEQNKYLNEIIMLGYTIMVDDVDVRQVIIQHKIL